MKVAYDVVVTSLGSSIRPNSTLLALDGSESKWQVILLLSSKLSPYKDKAKSIGYLKSQLPNLVIKKSSNPDYCVPNNYAVELHKVSSGLNQCYSRLETNTPTRKAINSIMPLLFIVPFTNPTACVPKKVFLKQLCALEDVWNRAHSETGSKAPFPISLGGLA